MVKAATKLLAVAAFICVIWSYPATAIEDTIQNRISAAQRYAVAIDIDKMMIDTVNAMTANMPSAEATKARNFAVKNKKEFQNDLVDLMARFFTADELDALANFYGSVQGQAITRKFPEYMAASQPVIQKFIERGLR